MVAVLCPYLPIIGVDGNQALASGAPGTVFCARAAHGCTAESLPRKASCCHRPSISDLSTAFFASCFAVLAHRHGAGISPEGRPLRSYAPLPLQDGIFSASGLQRACTGGQYS